MNYKQAKDYILSKPAVREDYPFGPEVMVAKIKSKMFATLGIEKGVGHINLKCDPAHAQELRDLFESIKPGYHMNKLHWNTIILDGSIPQGEVERLIDHSYTLVVKKLKRVEREALEASYGKDDLYRD